MVVGLVAEYRSADLADWKREPKEEDVQYPTCGSVTVREGMNCIEMIVAYSHANQGIGLRLVVKKRFPVGQLRELQVRGRVDSVT